MPIVNDAIFENSETFSVVLSDPANATILDGTGVGTIRDDGTGTGGTDNDTPTLSVTNVSVTEGTNTHAVFELSLSNASTTDVTTALALANVTAVGGGVDYGAAGAGNLQVSTDGGTTWNDATSATIAAGTTSVLVRTPITDDLLDENIETFTLTATRTVGTTTNTSVAGTGTITDNDAPPSLSINDVTVNEAAGTATFTVSLSGASGLPITVDYTMADGTALDGSDYTLGSGTVSFAAGETTQTIVVPILEDTLDELEETFTVNLAGATNATIEDGTAIGTITDNDAPPSLSIGDVTVDESAGTATFTVTLSAASGLAVTVDYATANGTALDGSDYNRASGTLNFAAGETTKTFTVPILEDAIDELDETFTATLSNPTATATIADATGLATITDNDATPALSINDVTVNEGAGTATFTVTLSAASGLPVNVNFATSSGTATSGTDFTAAHRDAELRGRGDDADVRGNDRQRHALRAEREVQRDLERAGERDPR